MDDKTIAGFLAGTAFIVGVGNYEAFDFNTQGEQRFVQRVSRAQSIMIGRHEHGPEQWPSTVQTFRGVQIQVTTPDPDRFVQFETLQEKRVFRDHLGKPVIYSDWIR